MVHLDFLLLSNLVMIVLLHVLCSVTLRVVVLKSVVPGSEASASVSSGIVFKTNS